MPTIKSLISSYTLINKRSSIAIAIGTLTTFMFAAPSFGHGYVKGERGDLCRQNINSNCSNVDPADTEHPGTFPAGGPPDGQLGSATRPYPQLNEQSATRWYKHGMSSGSNNFQWIIPAQHVSDNYRYYITKPGWNPNVPLARSAFDLTPFCEFQDNGTAPGNPTHNCNVPQRSGYHIILAIWQVSYTGAEFYSLIDANFDGSSQPGDGSSSAGSSSSGSSSSSPSTSALTNGNFETGDFRGWRLTGEHAGVDNNDAHAGDKAYFWSTQPYQQRIDQTVSGLVSGVYSISAQVKQNSGVPDVSRLELSSETGVVQYIDIPHGNEYVEITGTVAVNDGNIDIGFFQQAPGNTNLQIDAVTLTLLNEGNSSSAASSSSGSSSSVNNQCSAISWSGGSVYQYGELVAHNGSQWRAKWYTQGQEPGSTGDHGVWENNGSCH